MPWRRQFAFGFRCTTLVFMNNEPGIVNHKLAVPLSGLADLNALKSTRNVGEPLDAAKAWDHPDHVGLTVLIGGPDDPRSVGEGTYQKLATRLMQDASGRSDIDPILYATGAAEDRDGWAYRFTLDELTERLRRLHQAGGVVVELSHFVSYGGDSDSVFTRVLSDSRKPRSDTEE